MALGRKKAAAQTPPPPDAGTPISNAPEGFGDFSNIPSESTPQPAAPTGKKKAPRSVKGAGRKTPPVALMSALGVLLAVGAGAGIYSFMNAGKGANELPPEATAVERPGRPLPGAPGPGRPGPGQPAPPAPPGAPRPAAPGSGAPGAMAPRPLAPAAPAPGAPAPGAPAPAKAGGTAPRLRAQPGGQPGQQRAGQQQARVVVVPAVQPTPIYIATPAIEPVPGANPGIHDRRTARYVKPPSMTMITLKKLWHEGRAAKQRGDYAAARQAWSEALRIAQRDPALASSAKGFRESIAKLPVQTAPRRVPAAR